MEWRLEEVSNENYKISQQLKTLVQLQSEAEIYFERIFDKSLGFEEVFKKAQDEKKTSFDAQGKVEENFGATVRENKTHFDDQILEIRKNIEKKKDHFKENINDYKYKLSNNLDEISEQNKTEHNEHMSRLNDYDKKFKKNEVKHKEVAQLITVNNGSLESSVREVEESFSRVLFVQSRNSHDRISNLLHDTCDKVIT